ncbi:putative short-chain dehydrogenase/reductase family protein [Aspergillus saccharolyticus JOP 1030-1]|uniref:Putative short-chain dehydrogenase/reductase family protein n=1 Tax=Aspergillus saccharolyticus JOP 1030-1 TaxID=1450539 RepID=A0A319A1W0_9EURO|nr:putative short-chain dehydrogenase/reductase family protein [Aspergillus saccharolyticus JOP 1030-1]PYH41492.1 putative short-chain dehydrogenase/reductase family protein [Aspergillus saccharolyticus JOP 1030-1]
MPNQPPPPSPRILTTTRKPPPPFPPSCTTTPNDHKSTMPITLDLLLAVLARTLFHPFIAWILVLCLRAQATPYTAPPFLLATGYATVLSALTVLGSVNRRVAYGLPRRVDLSEEVVVVTGGASGLGLLIARIYAMRGVEVAVLDVNVPDEGEKKGREDQGEEGDGVVYYRCDVGDRGALEEVVRRVEVELGTPTVLVQCAAARINGQSLRELSAEAFQKTIRTNLLAAFHAYQVFLPRMLSAATGGTIVTVSSVLGQLCAAGLADYSASKAGLSAVHRTLEAELRASGDDDKVKMILVEPGQISTPLFQSVKTPSRFFAPVLEPVHVAQEIVSAIDSGRGAVIRLPTFAMLVNWYAVMPVGLQRIARYLSGIDNAVAQATSSQARPSTTAAPSTEKPQQTTPLAGEKD